MRIRMKSTRRGAEDGFTVREYVSGQEYELAATPRGDDLGAVFLREGWAEEVKSARPPPAPRESDGAPRGPEPAKTPQRKG